MEKSLDLEMASLMQERDQSRADSWLFRKPNTISCQNPFM